MKPFDKYLLLQVAKKLQGVEGARLDRAKLRSYTRKGPGIIPHRKGPNPAGSKLVRRFIRQARGEAVEYRRLYLELTGRLCK